MTVKCKKVTVKCKKQKKKRKKKKIWMKTQHKIKIHIINAKRSH